MRGALAAPPRRSHRPCPAGFCSLERGAGDPACSWPASTRSTRTCALGRRRDRPGRRRPAIAFVGRALVLRRGRRTTPASRGCRINPVACGLISESRQRKRSAETARTMAHTARGVVAIRHRLRLPVNNGCFGRTVRPKSTKFHPRPPRPGDRILRADYQLRTAVGDCATASRHWKSPQPAGTGIKAVARRCGVSDRPQPLVDGLGYDALQRGVTLQTERGLGATPGRLLRDDEVPSPPAPPAGRSRAARRSLPRSTGQGISSRSSYSAATGRVSRRAKSRARSWIACCSS